MICPMSFSNPEVFHYGAMECDPKCAFAFLWNRKLSCALAIHNVGMDGANSQPLDYDDDGGE